MAEGEKPGAGEVTRLLIAWSAGNRSALSELTPFIYKELRRLAASYLGRERPGHTLQPTGLVHEAYLRLVDQTQVQSPGRSQFFAIAANLMRQILVNHAKSRIRLKRGGGNKVELDENAGMVQPRNIDFVALDEALEKLAGLDPRKSRVVELRFFAGLTEDEIAGLLDLAPITVKREWRFAKAFLHQQLGAGVLDTGPEA